MIVLDTNVLSEPNRSRPSDAVADWFARQNMRNLFTTTVSEAEMLFGVALLPPGKRKDKLAAAFRTIFEVDFLGRVLMFDSAAARAFAELSAMRKKAGLEIKVLDTQIAAIARAHRAAVATRDVKDFEGFDIPILNPWTSAA